jgi:hypothetical protein
MVRILRMRLSWLAWKAGHVFLHDPAILVHPLRVSIGDFDLAWLERDEQFAILMPA